MHSNTRFVSARPNLLAHFAGFACTVGGLLLVFYQAHRIFQRGSKTPSSSLLKKGQAPAMFLFFKEGKIAGYAQAVPWRLIPTCPRQPV
jgi:hypothetical protein